MSGGSAKYYGFDNENLVEAQYDDYKTHPDGGSVGIRKLFGALELTLHGNSYEYRYLGYINKVNDANELEESATDGNSDPDARVLDASLSPVTC